MKVLVTGGAGFIGSHLVTSLCARGDDVTVFDNFSCGKPENIDGLDLTIIEGDLRDSDRLVQAARGMEVVFHQAAQCSVPRSMADPVMTMDVNAVGTLKLLEACRRGGVRRVVMASSSSVYGDALAFRASEDMKTEPLSPYALSKLIAEHYCRMYWAVYGLETVALRYFNVFGPRQDPDSEYAAVIPRFLKALLEGDRPHVYGDGSQTRDFTFVTDVVNANILAAFSQRAAGQVMNIACGKRRSLLVLLRKLEEILDCRARPVFEPRRSGDILHSQACIDRAARLIGFTPGVSFDSGMRETAQWFAEQLAQNSLSLQHESIPGRDRGAAARQYSSGAISGTG